MKQLEIFGWYFRYAVGKLRDLVHDVDTTTAPVTEQLSITRANRGLPYDPSPWTVLDKALSVLAINVKPFTFIDFGCGKGRVLLCALRHPFENVIGVEYSPVLSQVARRNIAKARFNSPRCQVWSVVNNDAKEFSLPIAPLILFFYNPFQGDVLRNVLQNVTELHALHPRPIFLVFFGASSSLPVIERFPQMKMLSTSNIHCDVFWRKNLSLFAVEAN